MLGNACFIRPAVSRTSCITARICSTSAASLAVRVVAAVLKMKPGPSPTVERNSTYEQMQSWQHQNAREILLQVRSLLVSRSLCRCCGAIVSYLNLLATSVDELVTTMHAIMILREFVEHLSIGGLRIHVTSFQCLWSD